MASKNLTVIAEAVSNIEQTMDSIAESLGDVQRELSETNAVFETSSLTARGYKGMLNNLEHELDDLKEEAQENIASFAGLDKSMLQQFGTTTNLATAIDLLEGRYEELNEEQLRAIEQSTGMSATAMAEAGSLGQLALMLRNTEQASEGAAEATDDLEDEMTTAALAAEALSFSIGATSVNLGAFNVALRNLTTQVPILIALLGTLTGALGGVASAAILAAGGIAGIFAGGMLAQAEAMGANFRDMESVMETLQEIARSLRDNLIEVMEPLMSSETATVFRDIIAGAFNTLDIFVRGIADSIDIITEFAERFGDIWFSRLPELVTAFQRTFDRIGDELLIFIDYILRAIPVMLDFFSLVTERVADMGLGNFMTQLREFTEIMVVLGTQVLSGILPVLGLFFDILESIGETLDSVAGGSAIQATIQFLALTFALNKVMRASASLIAGAGRIAESLHTIAMEANTVAGGFSRAVAGVQTFLSHTLTGFSNLGSMVAPIAANIAQNLVVLGRTFVRVAASQGIFAAVSTTASAAMNLLSVSAVGAALSFGTLGAVLAPITGIIAAIATIGAILVGVLGNIDGLMRASTNAAEGLVATLGVMVDAILPLFVNYWNLMVDAFEFFYAIGSGIVQIFSALIGLLPGVSSGASLLGRVFSAISQAIGGLLNVISGFMQWLGDTLDWIIQKIDSIPGVDVNANAFEGAKVTEETVRRGAGRAGTTLSGAMGGGSAEGQLTGRQRPQLTYNESNVFEQNGDINARPEDKQRLKRIVQDAMEEANKQRRRSDGGVG